METIAFVRSKQVTPPQEASQKHKAALALLGSPESLELDQGPYGGGSGPFRDLRILLEALGIQGESGTPGMAS